jgi:uncharacterized protein
MLVIDGHTHYFPNFAYMKGLTGQEFAEGLRSKGVDKAIVFTLNGFFARRYKKGNDELARLVDTYPDLLRAFCSVDPRDGPEALKELRRCVRDLGMLGLKFHNWLQAISAVDSAMFPIIEEAAKLNVPVLFHDGTPPYAETLQVAHLAARFPQATIILGHSGNVDFWRQAIRAAKKYPNIILSTCSSAPMSAFRRMVDEVGADRMVWGSDYPFGNGFEYLLNKVLHLNISDEDKEKILSGTMLKLLPSLR